MKKKILILTLVFILAGSVALGFTLTSLSQQQAYDSAVENNKQFEINELNLQLSQIAHEKNQKAASLLAYNNYNGQLTKYYNPFVSETNLLVKEMENEKAYKQLEIDVVYATINMETAEISYNESKLALDEATKEYNEALADPSIPYADQLALKYTMESLKISNHQAFNNLESAKRTLYGLIGQDDVFVTLTSEYSDPYSIDPDDAFAYALETDIGIFQSKRNKEAAGIKFDIAAKYYDEDDEVYINALAGLKSAELSYDKSLLSLEISVINDINTLKNKYDSIELAELNKKIKLDEYNASISQYNAGILSLLQLEGSEASYISAQKQLDSKIHDFILSSMRFTLDYGYSF